MKKKLTLLLLGGMLVSLLLAAPPHGQVSATAQRGVTIADLLNELARQLSNIGRSAEKRGQTNEARA
jgi:hypothetical protein